jgi:hypothetical protein
MEGGNPGPFGRLSKKTFHSLFHFIGRLVGESDGKDIPGGNPFFLNEVGDSVGQDTGLPTSRTGKDQEGPFGLKNGLLLNRIEIIEQRHLFSKCQMSKSKCQLNDKLLNAKAVIIWTLKFELDLNFEI